MRSARERFAPLQDLVDELGDENRLVNRIGVNPRGAGPGPFRGIVSLPSSRRNGCGACLRSRTPEVSSVPRTIL